MSTLLIMDRVSKQYNKDAMALKDISFTAKKGEFISIIGPSGAGKSTLLRCINRMIEPNGGRIVFDGKETSSLSKKGLRELRTSIGMIFQHYNLVERLSAIENVLHGRLGFKSTFAGALGIYSDAEKRQSQQLLRKLGLADHMFKRCDQLSGGQKQRVGIARALIQEPKMLLCDEPIASLDPNAAKLIMDHLKNITASMGITVLVNLHQVETALKYSDTIIGVNNGKIVFHGTPQELKAEQIHCIYGSDIPSGNQEASLAYEVG